MAEVLVLVDHVDGAVRKTTSELLTIARRLGEPAAVFVGRASTPPRRALAEYGAAKVYVVESPRTPTTTSSSPRSRRWPGGVAAAGDAGRGAGPARRRARRSPAASPSGSTAGSSPTPSTCSPGTPASRRRSPSSPAAYSVTAHVIQGTPVITVKPNSATPEPAPRHRRRCRRVDVTLSATPRRPRGSSSARPRRRAAARSSPRRRSSSPAAAAPAATSAPSRPSPTPSAPRSARPAPRSTPAGTRTATRSARPARGVAAAVRRGRHLRRHPAPGRHADVEDDRRGQQGPGGADLRARRLRRRRRPVHRAARRPPEADRASARADRSRRSRGAGTGEASESTPRLASRDRLPRPCGDHADAPGGGRGDDRGAGPRRQRLLAAHLRAAGPARRRGGPRAARRRRRRPPQRGRLHLRRHRGRQPRGQGPVLGAARRRRPPPARCWPAPSSTTPCWTRVEWLAEHEGAEVEWLPGRRLGRVDLDGRRPPRSSATPAASRSSA